MERVMEEVVEGDINTYRHPGGYRVEMINPQDNAACPTCRCQERMHISLVTPSSEQACIGSYSNIVSRLDPLKYIGHLPISSR